MLALFSLMELVGYTLIGTSVMYGIKAIKGEIKNPTDEDNQDGLNLTIKIPRTRRS